MYHSRYISFNVELEYKDVSFLLNTSFLISATRMADVHQLVFSILKFLEDQKKSGQLDDEASESLEGNIFTH